MSEKFLGLPFKETVAYVSELVAILTFLISIGSGVTLNSLPEFGFLDSFPSLFRFLTFIFIMPILTFYSTKLWSSSIRINVVWLSFSFSGLVSLVWINYSIVYVFFDNGRTAVMFCLFIMHCLFLTHFVKRAIEQIEGKNSISGNFGEMFLLVFIPMAIIYLIVPYIPEMYD